ncbi:hypothetical protein B0H17DRAFT_1134315 [Mycena rosella]|uniref:Uncharacterized protein n=1 Tax=Mycena rosella TaxID=1033263 RepID=A0AAD7DFJ2_MYCRO|nr:hypothetical protein B0H17DRAFT_1134315 [Mycena rosella]
MAPRPRIHNDSKISPLKPLPGPSIMLSPWWSSEFLTGCPTKFDVMRYLPPGCEISEVIQPAYCWWWIENQTYGYHRIDKALASHEEGSPTCCGPAGCVVLLTPTILRYRLVAPLRLDTLYAIKCVRQTHPLAELIPTVQTSRSLIIRVKACENTAIYCEGGGTNIAEQAGDVIVVPTQSYKGG